MWNSDRYEAGFKTAEREFTTNGASIAVAEYNALEGASAVDEFEVGFRTFLNLKGIDPEDSSTYAA